MSVTDGDAVSFPKGFLFGAATAAYQVEGSVGAGGRGVSIWDTFSHTSGNTFNGDTGDIACDHFLRLEEDLDLMAELGARAYRFSVSWPRVQPTGKGPANPEGLDFYRRVVDGLRARGILPVLTLYHWDLPQPLQDEGGWPQRDTVSRFAEYAGTVARALGETVGRWITLNEPWCSAWLGYGSGHHAPGIRDIGKAAAATHHLLLAHGEAVQAIRSAVPAAEVGISLNLTPIRHATDHADDVAAARRMDGNANRLFLDPLLTGSYPADMLEHYQGHAPGFAGVRDGDLEVISRPLDFLGINYYFRTNVASDGAHGFRDVPLEGVERTQMGWEVYPDGLRDLLTGFKKTYRNLPPIYITENGMASDDQVTDGHVEDTQRISFLKRHLAAVDQAIKAGVDIRGYFLWSLMDNFEWAFGYERRFGVVHVDYSTQKRTIKRSAELVAKFLKERKARA